MPALIHGETRYGLEGQEVMVGRAGSCDIVLSDAEVSRIHCKLVLRGQDWFLQDCQSKNGTLVDGAEIKEVRLKGGERITVGITELVYASGTTTESVRFTEGGLSDERDAAALIKPVEELGGLIQAPPASSRASVEEIARSNRILQAVNQMGKTLLSARDLQDTLEKVMDLLMENIPLERAYLMLYDPDLDELVPKVIRRKDGGSGELTLSRSIAYKAFRDRVSILTADAQMDPRFSAQESIRGFGIRSAMCVPLWSVDKVIGIVYIDSPMHTQTFQKEDLELLSAMANYAALGIERENLNVRIRRDEESRRRLERYMSPGVARRIMEAGHTQPDQLDAQEREVSIIFADLVGFGSLAEGMEPRQMVDLLNEYFTIMTEAVFQQEGTLDKYIGDALMAVFGAPLDQPDHADRAVAAAVEMRQALNEVNARRETHRLQFKVAINSGRVVAGDLGSFKRRDYTVLGHAVNIASRLEEQIAGPGQIVLGEETRRRLTRPFELRSLGQVSLKGMKNPVSAFEVLSSGGGQETREDQPET